MFKKPLKDIKTLAPLRSSDRRRLKQKVVQSFQLTSEHGDLLVPEGLLSVKFSTHLEQPGVAYFSPDGDPLWFTLGKGSDDLIPTVYTLWKQPNLLPFISTPPAVIPVLVGGADLMIPGVVQHSTSLRQGQLVGITQFERGKIGPPLAVGSMAVNVDAIKRDGAKGKAVLVLHTWNDTLFDQGRKGDPPEPTLEGEPKESVEEVEAEPSSPKETAADPVPEQQAEATLAPQEVSTLLRTSLLQALRTSLSNLATSAFPISATTFYTSHILPSRPAYLPSQQPPTLVDIKHSTHKSLTAFLKLCEKEGLIKLKDMKSEVVITAVFPQHADVIAHQPYRTLRDLDLKREKKEEAEEAEKSKVKELVITEKWKPHQQTIKFFEEMGHSRSALYSFHDIKSIVTEYAARRNLASTNGQQFINIDELLRSSLTTAKSNEDFEPMKREEVAKRLVDKMQNWYEVQAEGKDPIVKKGQLKPISVVIKIRQGRKASTLITNFEPFLLGADTLAEELRHICASATSVSPVPGKSAGLEVLVQGKQVKAVTDLLISKGVPKKWITE